MLEYSEKRDYIRMNMACEMQLSDPVSGSSEKVHLEDLSATGMRFFIERPLEEGQTFDASITPCNDITPPMQAQIRVLRCSPFEARFDIAASIVEVAPADYPEAQAG